MYVEFWVGMQYTINEKNHIYLVGRIEERIPEDDGDEYCHDGEAKDQWQKIKKRHQSCRKWSYRVEETFGRDQK